MGTMQSGGLHVGYYVPPLETLLCGLGDMVLSIKGIAQGPIGTHCTSQIHGASKLGKVRKN